MVFFRSKYPQQSIRNQSHVSITLATHLFSKKLSDNPNIVFSPLSIHAALSLLAAGSKGQTLDEILGFLKANSIDDLNSLYAQILPKIFADGSQTGGPILSFANGVWVDKTLSLKPSFKHVLDTVYKATCSHVDFQTKADEIAEEVNSWVEKQTHGVIEQVITPDAIDKLTWLIFTNAVYFKGTWSHKFCPSNTKEHNFYLLNGDKVHVPFMTGNNRRELVCEYDDFKLLNLPYIEGEEGGMFSMYIFLPDAKDGLQSLLEKIGSQSDFIDGNIRWEKVEIGQFLIPKFKISFGFEVSEMLKELGIVLPFSVKDGPTEIVDSSLRQAPYVSRIHHKSFLEVDEEGTKATASVLMLKLGAAQKEPEPKKIDFVADHPFLFMIREDWTKTILFMGQVSDPRVGLDEP